LVRDPFAEINEHSLELCSKEELVEIFKQVLFKPDFFAPKRFVLNYVKSRCFDKNLFNEIIKICHDNLIYFEDLWKQGLYHLDDLIIYEWIEGLFSTNPILKDRLGSNITSNLISVTTNEEIFSYFMKNFSSQNIVKIIEGSLIILIIALDQNNVTTLDSSKEHYLKFLSYLLERNKIQAQDKMLLAMFLIDQVTKNFF
jgi:hypothetical protein